MWNLKKQTSEYNKNRNRLTNIKNKQVVTGGEREVRRGKVMEAYIGMTTLESFWLHLVMLKHAYKRTQ